MRGPSLPPRYRLVRRLASGATSDVVLAHDTELDRDVAVKILTAPANQESSLPERFAREAVIAAELGRHPNIVTVHDTGKWRGKPFLVMELEPGGSVEDALERGPIHRERALRWLHETADAVDAAHAHGVVHRDLKPANLLLDEADRIRVTDFGIASAGDDSERITLTGTILGTAGYLSPEQARGERATAASDRYSLAVVACELLTGERPPVDHVPPSLAPVFDQALADRPEDRFPTASALVAAIEEALSDEHATMVLEQRPEASAATAVLHRRRSTGRARRRGRVLLATLVAGVAATAAALAFGYIRSDDAAPTTPLAVTCTVSPRDHDANLVVTGVGARSYCAERARKLAWTMRPGLHLRSPDIDEPLSVVCRARGNDLRITVYDNGKRELGTSVCNEFAPAGQAVGS